MRNQSKKFGLWLLLVAAGLLLAGCATKIRGWSQESFRSPDFNRESLNREGLALLPVIVMSEPARKTAERSSQPLPAPYTPPQKGEGDVEGSAKVSDGYQVILDEILLGKFRAHLAGLRIVPSGDALKLLNDAGMGGINRRVGQEFTARGVDAELLKTLGSVLHTRYVLIARGNVTEHKSDAAVSFVWTFGRKSALRAVSISAQIWDTGDQKLAWEGSGVGYNRLGAFEKAPLTEQMASEAVENLIGNLEPRLE